MTSKKPIQPSSANSDWCAWNMNVPGVRELDLDHAALPLALHDGVGVLPVVAGAGRLVAEEPAVQVETVDQVELRQVGEVDADELRTS